MSVDQELDSAQMDKTRTRRIIKTFTDGEIGPIEAARRLTYAADNPSRARTFLKARYTEQPKGKLLEEYGNISYLMGQFLDAEMAYLSAFFKYGDLHVANLISIGYPATVALVDDDRKILYIPIPKCASSTIKNFLSVGTSGETHGEQVHFRIGLQNTIVTPEDLTTRYAGYFKFAVVRDPIERVASYYYRNLVGSALKRDSYGRNVINGMGTEPSVDGVLRKYDGFRQYFLDFRHHTDPMAGYLAPFIGRDPELKIFTMGGVETIRKTLQDLYKKEMPELRVMASKGGSDDFTAAVAKLQPLKPKFAEDYAMFGDLLADPTVTKPTVMTEAVPDDQFGSWRPKASKAAEEKDGLLSRLAGKGFWRK